MNESDDLALLQQYVRQNSENAFAELVSRRVDFVYAAALRQVRDPHLAEEITQAVFIILAQKAGKISDRTILVGWLFRTTRFVALAQIRAAAKQSKANMELQMQTESQPVATDELWNQLAPLLDDALAQLGEADRQAVLLRFFDNKSLAEVGRFLGIGEDTARKRVTRALEKLHRYFNRRGIGSTSIILAGELSAHSTQAAPVGLAKTISAVALTKGAAGGTTLTLIKGALKMMVWSRVKTAVVVGVGLLLVAGTTAIIVGEMCQPQINFQAEGTLDGVGSYKHFTIFVKEDEWLIHFPIQTNGIDYEEDAYDGTNNYHYVQFDSGLNNSLNSSIGIVGTNDIPDLGGSSDKVTPVWLAYGAARYFEGITGNKVKSFFYVNRPDPGLGQGPTMEVEWKHSENPPYVPSYVFFQKLNYRYQVIRFTNFDGQSLPGEFLEDYFGPNGKTSNVPIISIHGLLSKISKNSTIQNFRPEINGNIYTEDRRFPGGGTELYVNVSKEWFSINSPQWQDLLKMYNPKLGSLVWPRGHQGMTWP